MKYRPEIDGLRALAVLPVLLFHAHAPAFTGGFVGVDIFFVISGYLITNIILSEIQDKKFSILNFYYRRILRIFPALFVVMSLSLIVGYFMLLPPDYNDLAKSIFFASFSVSNIYFFTESGYFFGTSLLKPALHTWSLGVEEQFYIFFPVMMMICSKWRNGLRMMLGAVLAVSFISSIYVTIVKPDAAFFLLPFRAWELGMGAFLAFNILPDVKKKQHAELLTWLGILMIGWSVFYYTPDTTFPGVAALLPCLGAFLIIWATKNTDTYGAMVLRAKPFVFIGAISYSLYLWHWPIFTFMQHTQVELLHFFWQTAIASIVSIFVAYLSYRFIETPFRKRRRPYGLYPVLIGGCVAMLFVAGVAVIIAKKDGFPQRYSGEVNEALDRFKDSGTSAESCTTMITSKRYKADSNQCRFGDLNAKTTVAIVGDSHANVYTKLLDELGVQHNIGMINMVADGCQPIFGITSDKETPPCKELRIYNERLIDELPNLKTVILAVRWPIRLEGRTDGLSEQNFNKGMSSLQDDKGNVLSTKDAQVLVAQKLELLSQNLKKRSIKLVIVYPTPEATYDIPWAYALKKSRGEDVESLNLSRADVLNRDKSSNDALDSLDGDIIRIHPDKYLCNDEICRVFDGSTLLYYDDDHLSRAGANLLKDDFKKAILNGK